MWLLAEPIGFLWIGDARTVMSLRLSAISMPCISLCSSVSGYFTACGRVWKPTLVHFAEQLLGIALVAVCLSAAPAGDKAERTDKPRRNNHRRRKPRPKTDGEAKS